MLGSFLVYLAYPLSKSHSVDEDTSLLWNKKVSGISLVISGTFVTAFSTVGLVWFQPFVMCTALYGCPSIFSFSDAWIDIFYGLALIVIGLSLLILNSRKEDKMFQKPVHDDSAKEEPS